MTCRERKTSKMKNSKRMNKGDVVLLKHTLAERLRGEIVRGVLRPGEKIVEGVWARTLSASQASIREAINILAKTGFVTKALGRSARVVSLDAEDVKQIYQVRGVIEGLAARLAAERGSDTAKLGHALEKMQASAENNDVASLLDANLTFHLELCRLSQNDYLKDYAFRILPPFFAFVRIRAIVSGQSASIWAKDFLAYQRIIELVREGEGEIVEQYIKTVMARIATTAYDSWEKKPSVPKS
jgi:DNA-binding GntR family transcriptional regulator